MKKVFQKALIIEDDPDSAELMKDKIASVGYGVIQAFNAQQGIEYARTLVPDIVLLDINLPDGRGEMVYSALESMDATKDVPVLIVSGETPARIMRIHETKSIERDDIFLKPLDFDALLAKMEEKLSNKKERAGKTILIADDDVSMSEILQKRLEEYGYASETVSGGYQAIETARKEKPDLIIMDVNMPDGSGSLAYGVLKTLKETKAVPIIMISGEDPAAVRRVNVQKSILPEDVFLKPLDFKRLLERINYHLFRSGK